MTWSPSNLRSCTLRPTGTFLPSEKESSRVIFSSTGQSSGRFGNDWAVISSCAGVRLAISALARSSTSVLVAGTSISPLPESRCRSAPAISTNSSSLPAGYCSLAEKPTFFVSLTFAGQRSRRFASAASVISGVFAGAGFSATGFGGAGFGGAGLGCGAAGGASFFVGAELGVSAAETAGGVAGSEPPQANEVSVRATANRVWDAARIFIDSSSSRPWTRGRASSRAAILSRQSPSPDTRRGAQRAPRSLRQTMRAPKREPFLSGSSPKSGPFA